MERVEGVLVYTGLRESWCMDRVEGVLVYRQG